MKVSSYYSSPLSQWVLDWPGQAVVCCRSPLVLVVAIFVIGMSEAIVAIIIIMTTVLAKMTVQYQIAFSNIFMNDNSQVNQLDGGGNRGN